SLSVGRYYHTATLLADGPVLGVGGYVASGLPIATAESFNPSGNSVSADASTAIARVGHAATLLGDGSVLVTGGISGDYQTIYRNAERYVPSSGGVGAFVDAGQMNVGRAFHTATALADGRVVVVGGGASAPIVNAGAEIFDPANGTF